MSTLEKPSGLPSEDVARGAGVAGIPGRSVERHVAAYATSGRCGSRVGLLEDRFDVGESEPAGDQARKNWVAISLRLSSSGM